MDRSTDFQPLWPPTDDDDFIREPEVRQARRMYRAQKEGLRDLARQATQAPVGADTRDTSQRIANMLHNIAGTAAHFDERDFGLLASRNEQPVLMLTARQSENDEALAYNAGAYDYLRKPVDLDLLVGRVEALLFQAGTARSAS